jgi:hypothetical protein
MLKHKQTKITLCFTTDTPVRGSSMTVRSTLIPHYINIYNSHNVHSTHGMLIFTEGGKLENPENGECGKEQHTKQTQLTLCLSWGLNPQPFWKHSSETQHFTATPPIYTYLLQLVWMLLNMSCNRRVHCHPLLCKMPTRDQLTCKT